jgi:hypothetical protein
MNGTRIEGAVAQCVDEEADAAEPGLPSRLRDRLEQRGEVQPLVQRGSEPRHAGPAPVEQVQHLVANGLDRPVGRWGRERIVRHRRFRVVLLGSARERVLTLARRILDGGAESAGRQPGGGLGGLPAGFAERPLVRPERSGRPGRPGTGPLTEDAARWRGEPRRVGLDVHRQRAELGQLRIVIAAAALAAQQDAEFGVDDGVDVVVPGDIWPAERHYRQHAADTPATRAAPRRRRDAYTGPPAYRSLAPDRQLVSGQQPGWGEQLRERRLRAAAEANFHRRRQFGEPLPDALAVAALDPPPVRGFRTVPLARREQERQIACHIGPGRREGRVRRERHVRPRPCLGEDRGRPLVGAVHLARQAQPRPVRVVQQRDEFPFRRHNGASPSRECLPRMGTRVGHYRGKPRRGPVWSGCRAA